MKNLQTVTGYLEVIKRLDRSINGNPRVLCRINDIEFCTTVDSGLLNYCENWNGREVIAVIGDHYNRLQLDSIKLAK